jgi:hypothetical protein
MLTQPSAEQCARGEIIKAPLFNSEECSEVHMQQCNAT